MNFSTPKAVLDCIHAGDDVARIRGENRVKVNNAANGFPPLTVEEADKMGMNVNTSFLDLPILLATARRQYTRNFNGTKQFFRISIPNAPAEDQTDWSLFMGGFINRVLKKSRSYFFLGQNRWTALVAHGIAPQLWWDNECWLPKFVPIEDWRVPTDTDTSLDNLPWFAVRIASTEGELTDKVFGEFADPNWKKEAIAKILHSYRNMNYEDTGYSYNWLDQPEKVAELIKQNLGYYSSDAVPTIPLWHFFYKDWDSKRRQHWKLCVVPDWNVQGDTSELNDDFLYQDENPFAQKLENILHAQFGDLSNTTPQKVWGVRALGFLLMEPCFWSNITICRTIQHLMESMNVWLRVADPAGKARAQKIELFNKAILPEGVSIVPQEQRHQVQAGFIELVLAQMKQKMSEASASYTQQSDTGTAKEQTAYETAVKMSMVNAMMEGLLLVAAYQERFSYEEICRRFCLRNTNDPDAKRFQEECKRKKIPKEFVNVDQWDIEPELPMGAGNPAMAISEAQQSLQMRPMYGPQAQQEILHDASAVLFGPEKAARWVPLEKKDGATPAQKYAEADFSTLMRGLPANPAEGVNLPEQINTLLGLLAGEITMVEKIDNMGDQRELIGLQNVAQQIDAMIQFLSQDPQQKQQAGEYSQVLGKLMNTVKGFQQRQQQQAQNNGHDPEAEAKLQATVEQTKVKLAGKQASDAQKLHHKEIAFGKEQQRKDAEFAANQQRESLATGAELVREHTRTQADIMNQEATAKADREAKVEGNGKE